MAGFDLEGFLPYQLAVLASRVSQGFSTLYRQKFGITIAEWRVVAHLSQQAEISVREICAQVELDKPKVSRAVARLEKAGYVSKKVHPGDRRLVSLTLTPKGRAMMAEIAPMARAFEAEVLGALGGDAPAFREKIQRLLASDRL